MAFALMGKSASAQCLETISAVNPTPYGQRESLRVVASDEGTMALYRSAGPSSSAVSSVEVFSRTANGSYVSVFETPDNTAEAGEYGRAVAISGDWMAVGVRDTDGPAGSPPGNHARVEMFHRGPMGWAPHSVIPSPFPNRDDLFADIVALEGDDLIVTGKDHELGSASQRGVVYVYRWINGAWEYRQKLRPDAPGQFLQYGTAAMIDDGVLVVEARFGYAFVYGRTDPTASWQLDSRVDDPAIYRFQDGLLVSKSLPNGPGISIYERDASGDWRMPPGFQPIPGSNFADEFEWDGRYLAVRNASFLEPYFSIYEWNGQALGLVRSISSSWFSPVSLANSYRMVDGRIAVAAAAVGPNTWNGEIVHLVDPTCQFGGRVECVSSQPNSLGLPSALIFVGSTDPTQNDVTFHAGGLPPSTFGMLLVSRTAGRTESPGNSTGTLCLGGAIGRFRRPGELFLTSVSGNAQRSIDLHDLPLPQSTSIDPAGETLFFQAWYRDRVAGAATSSFTSSITVEFAP